VLRFPLQSDKKMTYSTKQASLETKSGNKAYPRVVKMQLSGKVYFVARRYDSKLLADDESAGM
jgi:hypothetical protein